MEGRVSGQSIGKTATSVLVILRRGATALLRGRWSHPALRGWVEALHTEAVYCILKMGQEITTEIPDNVPGRPLKAGARASYGPGIVAGPEEKRTALPIS